MKNIFIIIAVIFVTACKQPAAEPYFSYSPMIVSPAASVTFDASCTKNKLGYYIWNFGDSTKDTAVASATIAHTYSIAGTYTVYLKVLSGETNHGKGSTYETNKTIVVH